MAKGQLFPRESRRFVDERTGAQIRQVTSAPAIHHHPFFMTPAYDDAGRWLFLVSLRTGTPQIFAEVRETGELLQLTDRDDLNEWSVHPSHDGNHVYFTAGASGWRVAMATLEEERLVDFGALAKAEGGMNGPLALHEPGMVAAAMGTTSLSACDRWWAVKFNDGRAACLAVVDTATGDASVILRRDTIAHLQFCPDDANLLFYAGPLTDRVWVVERDGTNNRRLYRRAPGEWITHESWIPGTREIAFVDWPNGIRCVNVDSGQQRHVTNFNAWHAVCARDGTRMVADTNFPDIGLQVFNPRDGVGAPSALCYPEASSVGEHWNGPFPYDNGPIVVHAPQHTHPHPSFSPDGAYVVYTSDRTGFAQVHEVELGGV